MVYQNFDLAYCHRLLTVKYSSILMDESRCSYGNNIRKIVAHSSIQRGGSHFIWDIEDIAKIGRRTHGMLKIASYRILLKSLDIHMEIVLFT